MLKHRKKFSGIYSWDKYIKLPNSHSALSYFLFGGNDKKLSALLKKGFFKRKMNHNANEVDVKKMFKLEYL